MRNDGQKKRSIIGVIGKNASGKDALAEHLQHKCGIPTISPGDMVRAIAEREGKSKTRESLHKISQRYFAEKGERFFIHEMIRGIQENHWSAAVIVGLRTLTDVETLQEQFRNDFLLVYVKVGDPRIRFQRSQKRDAVRDPNGFAKFLEQDLEEEELFGLQEAIKQADITILNEGSLAEFKNRIERELIPRVICPDTGEE